MHRDHVETTAHLSAKPLRSMQMMDIIMLALGLAFFALSVGYTVACDRL
jgi:hypothetical protein